MPSSSSCQVGTKAVSEDGSVSFHLPPHARQLAHGDSFRPLTLTRLIGSKNVGAAPEGDNAEGDGEASLA